MNPSVATALLAALLPAALAAGDAGVLKSLKYLKPVEGDAPTAESLLSAEFSPDIYSNSGDAFEDVRLFNGDSKEIPFAVKRLDGTPKKRVLTLDCPSKVASLDKLPDNKVEIIVERLPDRPESKLPVDAISIDSPTRNFEKRVAIYGLEEDGSWTELCREAPLFDYSAYMDFSRKSVPIPESLHKSYRISISNYTEDKDSSAMELVRKFRKGEETTEIRRRTRQSEILKIDGISICAKKESALEVPPLLKAYALHPLSTEERGGDSILSFETGRAPLRRIEVETESSAFMRDALLESSADGKAWRFLASARLHRLNLAGVSESKLSIEFPEIRAPHLRLTIRNGDAPPLKISGLKAEGSSYCAEFIAKADDVKGLRLYYGGAGVKSPNYDAPELIAKLKSPQAVQLRLGEAMENPLYTGVRGDAKPFDSRAALIAAIILVAILMGALLIWNMRRIDSMPEDN